MIGMLGADGPGRNRVKMPAGPNLIESQHGDCIEHGVAPAASGHVECVTSKVAESSRRTVMRRGVFGGPLHVRTGSGGEFAIDARLALAIEVEPATDGAEP